MTIPHPSFLSLSLVLRDSDKKRTKKRLKTGGVSRRSLEMMTMTSMPFGKQVSKSQRNDYGIDNPDGVGIVFKSGPDEALFVKALVPH
jgi:hypothetical protein